MNKFTHGGARKGAGRKPSPEFGKVRTVPVTLYEWHIMQLTKIDPKNLSKAIRILIESKSKP